MDYYFQSIVLGHSIKFYTKSHEDLVIVAIRTREAFLSANMSFCYCVVHHIGTVET